MISDHDHSGFCIDTSSILDLSKGSPIDIFPGPWEDLTRLIQNGDLLIHRSVREEVLVKDDLAAEWMKTIDLSLLHDIDTPQNQFISYMGTQEKYLRYQYSLPEYVGKADPYLIALAHVHDLVVITNESPVKEWRIPHVCQRFEVCSMDLFAFLRLQKWTYRRA